MVPTPNQSCQKPKPLTPSHTQQHQHQPCSSSLPPLMTANDDSPYSLSPHPPPPDPTSHDAEIARQLQLSLDIDGVVTLLNDDPKAQGSTSNGVEGFLKRGIDDTDTYFMGLSPLDEYVSAKRTRVYYPTYDHPPLLPSEPKGKGTLSDGDSTDDHDSQRSKEPPVEIDFLSVFSREQDEDESGSESETDSTELDEDAYNLPRRNEYMRQFRDHAKRNASRFARSTPDDGSPSSVPQVDHEIDGSTPFSAAMKLVKDRVVKSTQKGYVPAAVITWVSRRSPGDVGARLSAPSLQELCLEILANHADAIVSLDGVPDELRHRLSRLLCDSRKMNGHFLELLVSGSPTEIRLKDCSWLTEEQFTKSFQTCDTARLEVLQLDQCGRCIADYTLLATLSQSPRWLPRLTSLSLSGACRLSDKGLHELVSSAPVLRSINLSQCSLLTSASLDILADSLGSLLKELYLDDCLIIDAALIVPALKRLQHLEVLSLAGIQTVSDEFIKDYIIACGHNMKELVLKDCMKLTDASMKVIAEHCPGLHALDLMNLCKLTDLSIGYISNSCRALHTLKLCRNPFSDETIAAFLETTGESLKELSLNNVKKVGHQTTLSLASHAKNLHTLDLSWCRNLTDNELGLIVDSCFSLRLLKLFGCTQVTDVFLNGHSNTEIQIMGSKMSPLLQHVKVPDPHQGALRYSAVSVDFDINWNQK